MTPLALVAGRDGGERPGRVALHGIGGARVLAVDGHLRGACDERARAAAGTPAAPTSNLPTRARLAAPASRRVLTVQNLRRGTAEYCPSEDSSAPFFSVDAELPGTARSRRRDPNRARRHPHSGVHSRRHPGDRQGGAAGDHEKSWCTGDSGQRLPPVPAAGARHRRGGRRARRIHELAGPHIHRQRRDSRCSRWAQVSARCWRWTPNACRPTTSSPKARNDSPTSTTTG